MENAGKREKLFVAWLLDEEGRKANLFAGGDGEEVQAGWVDMTVANLVLATVDVVGFASIRCGWDECKSSDGKKMIRLKVPLRYQIDTSNGTIQCDHGVVHHSIDLDALAALELEQERRRALKRELKALELERDQIITAQYQIDLAEVLEKGAEGLVRTRHDRSYNRADESYGLDDRVLERYKNDLPEGLVFAATALIDEKEKSQKNYKEAQEKNIKKQEEEKERKREKDNAERADWVEKFGSPRLRKAMELNLLDESQTVYREERIAYDWPGWRVDDSGPWEDIRNPSEEALEALEAARKKDPRARLEWAWWKGPCGTWERRSEVVVVKWMEKDILLEVGRSVDNDDI